MTNQHKNNVIKELNRLIKQKEEQIQECNKVMKKIENAEEPITVFFSNCELYAQWDEQKTLYVKKLDSYKELLIVANN